MPSTRMPLCPPAMAGHLVGVPAAHVQAGHFQGGCPQRALERDPAGTHPHGDLSPVRPPQPGSLRTGGRPPPQGAGQFLLQRADNLVPECVRVVELHDAARGQLPSAAGPGSRSTAVTWSSRRAGQAPTNKQAGPAPMIATRMTATSHVRYTNDAMTTFMVHSNSRARQTPGRVPR